MTKPTETCWCGCGEQTTSGGPFLPGHDRKAESAVIKVEYGSIKRFLEAHGYGPGGKNPQEALAQWQQGEKRVR